MRPALTSILAHTRVEASAPCRIDMGGTLDIRTLNLPLGYLAPCTVNMALDLRTRVRLNSYRPGWVRVASRGFEAVAYPLTAAPLDHPMGLMFAIAAYFGAHGVNIEIESASPPRSALGGSSAAGVALVAALGQLQAGCEYPAPTRDQIARLAFVLEESVAGVPCGLQDQLAAVYGGVNVWHWRAAADGAPAYDRQVIVGADSQDRLQTCLLQAYCGVPHESRNINQRWIKQFLTGRYRSEWVEIVDATRRFADALAQGDFFGAVSWMNRETDVRRKLTPDVLDDLGVDLVAAARAAGCGARFTGAGGGGCLWALGNPEDIGRLRPVWQTLLVRRAAACLLDAGIDNRGLVVTRSGR